MRQGVCRSVRFFRSQFIAKQEVGRQGWFRSEKAVGQALRAHLRSFGWEKGAPQIPPLRYPRIPARLVALAKFMRSSLTKTAHVDLSYVAKQEFGYATVGMTNLLEGRDGKFA